MTFGGVAADVAYHAPFIDDNEENKGETGANNGSNLQHEHAEDEIIGQNNEELCLSDLEYNNEGQRDDQNYDLNIYKANSGTNGELQINTGGSMIGRSESAHENSNNQPSFAEQDRQLIIPDVQQSMDPRY